eukprot:TRINITY_DN13323_c0_g1_i2.p1 TRINITY_DN13323_c0_g1~~TRINITY_DN13323_c0_g1_i2.p1  ORF type:complete len:743 (+),score=290.61 TRINITY_DN13323_c0_g1_i2:92-2230(+)
MLKKRNATKKKAGPRLLHVKGKRLVRVIEVEPACSSMNEGDVFLVLPTDPKRILVWLGPGANRMEKSKAVELVETMKHLERKGAEATTVSRGPPSDEFLSHLSGGVGDIKGEDASQNDIEYEREVDAGTKLYELDDDELELIDTQKLERRLLATTTCYVLEVSNEMYVWCGKKSKLPARSLAMQKAKALWAAAGKPEWASGPVKVTEDGEPLLFKQKFAEWPSEATMGTGSVGFQLKKRQKSVSRGLRDSVKAGGAASAASSGVVKRDSKRMSRTKSFRRSIRRSVKKGELEHVVDPVRLHTGVRPEQVMVDDGSGVVEGWRVKGGKLVEDADVPRGHFWDSECYVVLYRYEKKSGAYRYLIYFWAGAHCNRQDRGLAALLTKEVAAIVKGRGGDWDQHKSEQWKESDQFLVMFKGRMVIHQGRKDSKAQKKDSAMYHIHGRDDLHTRAVQTAPDASALNSRDIFVVNQGKHAWVWKGKGSSMLLQEMAEGFVQSITEHLGAKDTVAVNEGEEDKKLWKALGGQKEYACEPSLCKPNMKVRLFHCGSVIGRFNAEEVHDFSQSSLDSSDVFILDTMTDVYVWCGKKSKENDRNQAMELATQYVEKAFDGRLQNTPVWTVEDGEEPLMFACHFHAWQGPTSTAAPKRGGVQEKAALKDTYTFEELTAKDKPKGLDGTKLEVRFCIPLAQPAMGPHFMLISIFSPFHVACSSGG